MISLFHNASLVQYHDQIRVPDGGETVGDDDAGAPFHHFLHGILDGFFRSCVYVGGGFVQNQDAGIGHEGPGDGQQLSLALADVFPGSRQQSFIALRQQFDHFMAAAHLRCFFYLFCSRIFVGVLQVMMDGIGEENCILQHDAHVFPQAVPGDFFHILVVDPDSSFVGVVVAHQQIDHGGLAAAGGTYQCYLFARRNRKVKVLQHRFALHVTEFHVLETYGNLFLVFPDKAVQVLAGFVQHLENTFRARDGGLQLPVDLGDFIDGTAELFGVHDEGGDDAHGDHAVDGEVAAKGRDDHKADVADTVHHRTHDAAADFGADTGFGQFVGNIAEPFRRFVLLIVGDNRAVPVDDFFHGSVHTAQ